MPRSACSLSAGAVESLMAAQRFRCPSTAAACSWVRNLILVCNEPRFPWLKLTLPSDAVGALGQCYCVMLFMLNASRRAIDPEMGDVKAIWDVMGEIVVPEHRNTLVYCMPVTCRFTFQKHGCAIRSCLERISRHRNIAHSFDEQVALRVQQTHYILLCSRT